MAKKQLVRHAQIEKQNCGMPLDAPWNAGPVSLL